MQLFSIGKQIQTELDDCEKKKVMLASTQNDRTVRYLSKDPVGYYYNQRETINLIDLYSNSKFETGENDSLGQKKIFLNIGKFRAEVSAKQIDIDTKDFRFIPDDYADPYTALFLQKDFKEWAKDTEFGELVNQCVDNFPKYGSVVLKEVGNDVEWMPLQNLYPEQTADDLQTASYVIEEHPDMNMWELQTMKGWSLEGLQLKYGEKLTVYERYGYVPRSWLDSVNGKGTQRPDDTDFVDAVVIAAKVKSPVKTEKEGWHIFFAGKVSKRPYREAHWNKQHGRWLGLGVVEDLFENQKAKNLVVNLVKRSMEWSGKRILQSASEEVAAKNLVRDVRDGDILEVGSIGAITEVPLTAKTNADFGAFLDQFEKNSDQKAFTYEVATGEALPSGTPFRLGVVLSNATNSFFNMKREKLGLFLKKVILDFKVPKFLRDMGDKKRVVQMFSGEPGFDTLKDAAMRFVQSEAARVALLSGQTVDVQGLTEATQPFETAQVIPYEVSYAEAKFKFDFTVTGEEIELESKIESLKSISQVLQAAGDARYLSVLERIASLVGENLSQFGPPRVQAPQPQAGQSMPSVPNSSDAANAVPAGA